MLKINIHINDEIKKAIKNTYGKDDYSTVACVVNDILDRYLSVKYFDSELILDESDDHEVCDFCGEKSKHGRLIDVDGRNLVELDVCENCGSGYPALEQLRRGFETSLYCSRVEVKNTFGDLITNAKARYIFLSYNNEGLMTPQDIKEIMETKGEYRCFTGSYAIYSFNWHLHFKLLVLVK